MSDRIEFTHDWIRKHMPVILTFNGCGDKPVQVILQGTLEQERVHSAVVNLKVKRGKPLGGAWAEMFRGF